MKVTYFSIKVEINFFSSLEECLRAEKHTKIVTIEKLTCGNLSFDSLFVYQSLYLNLCLPKEKPDKSGQKDLAVTALVD